MVPSRVDQDYLNEAGNDDILYGLYHYALGCLDLGHGRPHRSDDEKVLLLQLPLGLRSLYFVGLVRFDIANGGFEELLCNGNSYFTEEIEQSLELVGAIEHLNVFRKFRPIHDDLIQRHPILRKHEIVGLGANRFDEVEGEMIDKCWEYCQLNVDPILDNLTREFYSASDVENIPELLLAHVRANPTLYFHPQTSSTLQGN